MNTNRHRIASVGLLMLAPTLCASSVEARTISAVHARPDPNEATSCYRWFSADMSATGLERLCAGVSYVDIAVPVDTSGNKNLTVYASKPTTQAQLSCSAVAITRTGGFVPGTSVKLTASGTSFQPVVLPAINVATGGSLFVRCVMAQGTRIMEVEIANP